MEILNNFASIYCYISFVIGAVLMLVALAIAAMGKDNEPRNKVRFYITCEVDLYHKNHLYTLWMGKPDKISEFNLYTSSPKRKSYVIALGVKFHDFGLNPDYFIDMKVGEIREVFLNLED